MKGYIFLGTDDEGKTTNIECAAMLSLSIKLADPKAQTCVVVHKFTHVPKRYENNFDYIVELPFGRTEINHGNIYLDFWQLYHCTPFKENIFINTNSIAIDNIKSLWEFNQIDDIVFGNANDFRGKFTRNNEKFIVQDRNKIPAFNTDVIYFNKNNKAREFFKMADPIFKGWRDVYRRVLNEYKAEDFDLTLMINIVAYSLGENYKHPHNFNYTDLEINFCYDPEKEQTTDWLDSLNIWITDNIKIKVNNSRQTGILHYGNPRVINPTTIKKLNDNYSKAKKTLKI